MQQLKTKRKERRNTYLVMAALSIMTLIMLSGYANATFPSNVVALVPITLTNLQSPATNISLQTLISFNAMNTIYKPYEANDLGNIRFYQSLTSFGNVSITFHNTNTLYGTGSPFQQMLSFNPANYISEEAYDLGNIRFYKGGIHNTANELYAWCESGCSEYATNSVWFINLPGGIGANNIAIINMTFLSPSTEFDGVYSGEAPQLSKTYGLYDNGNYVFTQYGGGGAHGWSSFTPVGGTWLTSSGYLQQTSTGGGMINGPSDLIKSIAYSNTGNYVIAEAFNYSGAADNPRVGLAAVMGTSCSFGCSSTDAAGYRFIFGDSGAISFLNDYKAFVVSGGGSTTNNTNYTLSITDSGGTWSGKLYKNYSEVGSPAMTMASTTYTTTTQGSATSGYVGISAAANGGVDGQPINVQWWYLRQLPPGGVMPSATFNTLTGTKIAPHPLLSWCESGCTSSSSNAIFWVRMANVIRGASNSVINMTFLSTNTEYDGVIAGEAPQWTTTGYNSVTIYVPAGVYQNDSNSYTSPVGNGEADVSANDDGGASVYLCAGGTDSEGGESDIQSVSWNQDYGYSFTATGYQTGNNNCAMYYDDRGNNEGSVAVIGVNSSAFSSVGNSQSGGGLASVSWTPATANELDVVLMACGDSQCTYSTVPSGCSQVIDQIGSENDEVQIYTCSNLALSSQTADVQSNDEATIEVFQFPQNPKTVVTPINYGKYDNGPWVFNYYTNFTGPSLPKNLTTYGHPTYTVSGGLSETAVNNGDFIGSTAASGFNAIAFITDLFGRDTSTVSNDRFFTIGTAAGSVGAAQYFQGENYTYESFLNLGPETTAAFPPYTLSAMANAIYSLWQTPALAFGAYNYTTKNTVGTPPVLNPGYYQLGGSDSASLNFYQWLRRRLVPPNGIMPSVSFGSLISPLLSVCPAGPFTVVSGIIYVNRDPANILVAGSAYIGPGTTNGFVNTTQAFMMTSNGAVGLQVVQYGWNFSQNFTTAPNVIIQCEPLPFNPVSFASGVAVSGWPMQSEYVYLVVGLGAGLGLALMLTQKTKGAMNGRQPRTRKRN